MIHGFLVYCILSIMPSDSFVTFSVQVAFRDEMTKPRLTNAVAGASSKNSTSGCRR
jgi:hypothetical protein